METKTLTLDQFADRWQIKFSGHRVNTRPDALMSDIPMRHFRVRIGCGRNSFGLYFSQGMGHTENPKLIEVLDCLASDASGYENAQAATSSYQNRGGVSGSSFVNWAEEYGYDTDSRAAEKIFKTVKRQANQLKRVLGEEAYQELLYNTERMYLSAK